MATRQLLWRALRRGTDRLSTVSEYAIRTVLLTAGCTWQRARRRRRTGQVVRKRKASRGGLQSGRRGEK